MKNLASKTAPHCPLPLKNQYVVPMIYFQTLDGTYTHIYYIHVYYYYVLVYRGISIINTIIYSTIYFFFFLILCDQFHINV